MAAVCLTQVIEVGGEALGAFCLQDGAQGQFCLGGVPNYCIICGTTIVLDIGVIELEVLVYQCFHVSVLYLAMIFHQLAGGTIVHVVTHTLLGFHFVTISYGHVVHLVAETDDKHILCICPSCAYAHPNGNLLLGFFLFPIANNHFATNTHASADMAKLTVAMSGLVQVHEIHIHGIPWNFLVVLSVQVEQGLLQLLQSMYPHLGRREGVHPGDDTHALVIVVCGLEYCLNLLGGISRAFIYHLDGEQARVVQASYHFL